MKKWTADDFLKEYNIDLENIGYDEISSIIGSLPEEKRKIVLSDKRIINDYKTFLLECKNTHSIYNKIFEHIDFYELKDIFLDELFWDSYYAKEYGYEYTIFASAFHNTKDKERLLDLFLNNDILFDYLKVEYRYLDRIIKIIDNERLKKMIDKLISTNQDKMFKHLRLSDEQADFILKEDYPIKILYEMIVQNLSLKKQQEFFESDQRAELVIPYLTHTKINHYLQADFKFSNNIIKNPNFFELLKTDSLIQFRYIINQFLHHCNNPHYIEEKVRKYYESLIDSYQPESGLFKQYEEILQNETIDYKDLINNKDPYIFNIKMQNKNIINYEILKEETSLKLSELIVDYLFQDNIYNVWINIKELLRYNEYLNEEEKILSKSMIEIYNMILNIDKYPNNLKIEIFNILKSTDINTMFYNDLRNAKDLAYNKIKDKLINPTIHTEYISREETEKHSTTVYDLRDKEFYMLVRVMSNKYNSSIYRQRYSSYSIISNNNTEVFHDGNEELVIYGYNNFDIDTIKHMYESDSYTSGYSTDQYEMTSYTNRILSIKELVDSPGYNEILIKNKYIEDNYYHSMKPDFIVVIDTINEKSIRMSKELNIPIVIINKNRNYTHHRISENENNHYDSGIYNGYSLRSKSK